MSDYGQGIEPRLRDHYVGLRGKAYWKEHRSEILNNVLGRTHTPTQRTAIYSSRDKRRLEAEFLQQPREMLLDAGVWNEMARPISYYQGETVGQVYESFHVRPLMYGQQALGYDPPKDSVIGYTMQVLLKWLFG